MGTAVMVVPAQAMIELCQEGATELWITQERNTVVVRLENLPRLIAAMQEQLEEWKLTRS